MLIFGAQASVCVRLEDGAALLDADGGVIVPLGTYGDIARLDDARFAASTDGLWALMDEGGALLTPALYEDLRIAGGLVAACIDGQWGLLGRDGDAKTEFLYTRIAWDESGAFWALKTNPADMESDVLFLLDGDGIEQETGLMVRRLGEASQGRIAVQLPDGLWGYCDADGELVIPARYGSAGAFVSGCAPVTLDGCFGAIDTSGNMIVPAQYDALEISSAGVILASAAGEGVRAFSSEGAEIAFYPGDELFGAVVGDGYAIFAEETYVYGPDGSLLHTASAKAAVYEGLNGQILLADGAWGESCVYIAGTENAYQNLYPLGMAGEDALYACMQVNAARYMNDLLNEEQLAVDMDSARYGVTNDRGETLLNAEYESIEYLGEGRLLLYAQGLWQMADSAGNVYWSHGVRQDEAAIF